MVTVKTQKTTEAVSLRLKKIFEYVKFYMFNPAALHVVSFLILITELILNIFVVHRVPYTEIDWIAYMQECEGFLNGTTNYALLKGDTGPLVYPAVFVYVYSGLYYITTNGKNIRLAQYIFIGIYLLQMWLVLRLYSKSRKVPPYVLVISAFTSYRIHSIYTLRLFNDPVAILFLYASLNLFLDRYWTLGSICFSLGVGVKMNILLFAPALFLFYITNLSLWKAILQLLICGLLQLVVGAPFLLSHPIQYIKGSFDFGRTFLHKWTVNYRFLSENIFENKFFHLALLLIHVLLLLIFAKPTIVFFKNYARLRVLQDQLQPRIQHTPKESQSKLLKKSKKAKISSDKQSDQEEAFLNSFEKMLKNSGYSKKSENPSTFSLDQCTQLALLPFFLCNFIGVLCARSLHYQFYVWYFHSLPYLTWSTNYSPYARFLILGLIEFCWNVYPSTIFSSCLLHITHFTLLFGIGRKLFKTTTQSAALSKQF